MEPGRRLLPGHPRHRAPLPAPQPSGSCCLQLLHVGFRDRAQLWKETHSKLVFHELVPVLVLLQGLGGLWVPLVTLVTEQGNVLVQDS